MASIIIPGNVVIAGQANSWTVADFTPTSVTYAGLNITTFNNSSITLPPIVADTTYPAFAAHALVATDGVETVTLPTVTLAPPAGYNVTTLTSAPVTEGYIGFYLSCQVGDQILVPTPASLGVTVNNIAVDGLITSDFSGDQTLWHRNTSTSLITELEVQTADVAEDTVPDAFNFTDVTSVGTNTLVESNSITIAGTTAGANVPITVTGGLEYRIFRSAAWTAYTTTAGNIVLGEQLQVRLLSSSSYNTGVSGTITVGGVADTYTVTTMVADTVPTAFTFTDVTGAGWSVWAVSDAVTIAGTSPGANVPVTITGGEYSIFRSGDWTSYTATAGNIVLGEQLRVRVTTSALSNTAASTTVTVGGVSDTFTATTGAIDLTPDAFNFTDVTDAVLNAVVESNTVTLSGITPANDSPITVSGGLQYSIFSGTWGAFTSSPGVIQNGGQIKVRLTASSAYSTGVTGSITIGGMVDSFTVTTAAADTTPNAFTFTSVTDAAFATLVESTNNVTVTGVSAGVDVPITVSGGLQYATSPTGVTWSSFTSAPGVIQLNQLVKVAITSSAVQSTPVVGTITIGGVSTTFTVTTMVADTVPNAFTFTPAVDVVPSSVNVSAAATVSGVSANYNVPISITGGQYSIFRSGAWTSYTASAGNIQNGEQVRIQVTASSSYSTPINAVLTIGGVTGTYTVTTVSSDIVPDAFTFTAVTNANLNVTVESNAAVISGMTSGLNSPVTITGSGAMYSVLVGGNWSSYTSTAGNIQNGQSIRVLLTSSGTPETPVSGTVTIGGVSSTFTVTTLVADTVPDTFTFVQLNDANRNTTVISNSITVAGLTPTVSSPITVTGMQYSIYSSGSWSTPTSSAGVVYNGNLVRAHLATSNLYGTPTSGQVIIGGVSATFTATTVALDTTPNPLTFPSVTNAALSSLVESQPVTIAGTTPDENLVITITGGSYAIYRSGAWTAYTNSAGTVVNGEQIKVRVSSSASYDTAVVGTVIVGGVSGTFTVTTIASVDTVPNDFTISTVSLVDPMTSVESTPVAITGLTPGYDSPVSATNLVYSVYRNSVWSAFSRSAGTIRNGEYFKVSVISSFLNSTTVVGSITIGGLTRTYTVGTISKPIQRKSVYHDKLS